MEHSEWSFFRSFWVKTSAPKTVSRHKITHFALKMLSKWAKSKNDLCDLLVLLLFFFILIHWSISVLVFGGNALSLEHWTLMINKLTCSGLQLSICTIDIGQLIQVGLVCGWINCWKNDPSFFHYVERFSDYLNFN